MNESRNWGKIVKLKSDEVDERNVEWRYYIDCKIKEMRG
jgi:hypothetical protein